MTVPPIVGHAFIGFIGAVIVVSLTLKPATTTKQYWLNPNLNRAYCFVFLYFWVVGLAGVSRLRVKENTNTLYSNVFHPLRSCSLIVIVNKNLEEKTNII